MKRSMVAIWLVLAFAALAWGHGDKKHVMGTVSKVEGMNITVKTHDGSVKITIETKYTRAGSVAKLDDVKVGDRVLIRAKAMGDVLHATEVKIGEASKESAHQH